MRNWNAGSGSIRHGQFALFSAYLWGIETPLRPLAQENGVRFQPTYEELKHRFFRGPWRHPDPVFSLPMRNWNAKDIKSQHIFYLVFSLPMRNWNVSSLCCLYVAFCFQPTYEELKHAPVSALKLVNLCFQPTYEELKLLVEGLKLK